MIDTYSIPHTVQVPYIHGAFLAVASQAKKVHCFVCIAHTSKCYTILMYLYLSFGELVSLVHAGYLYRIHES